MWRCPRCVTHCKDELDACPVCRHARPERPVDRGEEDWSDLDAMFPPRSPPTEPLPLVPDVGRRNLEQNVWTLAEILRLLKPFCFGLVVGVLYQLVVDWETPASTKAALRHLLPTVGRGLSLGTGIGMFAVPVWMLVRLIFFESSPSEKQQLAARLAAENGQPDQPNETGSAETGETSTQAIRPSPSDLHPGDRP
jgi:hypothetical protein